MAAGPEHSPEDDARRLVELEQRVTRLEYYVGLRDDESDSAAGETGRRPLIRSEDELEYAVGEGWFGRAGIAALAVGGAFLLSLPYPGAWPPLPSIAGGVAAVLLFAAAHCGRRAFEMVSSYLRGAAMALFYCATLRLYFFGADPVLRTGTAAGQAVLVGSSAVTLLVAWNRRSPPLTMLALLTVASTALVVGSARFALGGAVIIASLAAIIGVRPGWRALMPVGLTIALATYFLWAMGNPVLGRPYRWAAEPAGASLFLLLCVTIVGVAPLWWRQVDPDTPAPAITALLNCTFGYGLFLAHTYAVKEVRFEWLHGLASLVFLWLASALWLAHRSRLATFFYAMGGYAALSMAIIRVAPMPQVLVWLSAESLLVVATAIWFQSRFIVVTNFAIYVLVVLGYMVLNERETGVSLGFGIVALVSARLLNWQRHRLELQTDLMRNAYLLGAFVVFPYALYHLATPAYAAGAWVALAVVYYVLNRVIRNQKYRWMGHATLLLSAVYLVIPGHVGLTANLRIASLLLLGAVLLVVSLVFTRLHRGASKDEPDVPGGLPRLRQ